MKIVGIDVYAHRLSYVHGEYAMSMGRVARYQDSTLVRVRTDEGIDGWGESCPLGGTYLPSFPGGIRAALAELAAGLVGLDPRDLIAVQRVMRCTLKGNFAAKSAIDIACWDILGKAASLPLATLLGGRLQDDFPLYEAVPLADPETMADFVERRKAAGIHQFQVKVGNDPTDDAARVRAVLEVSSSSDVIIADANGGWCFQDAVVAMHLFKDFSIFLEQPCETMAECAALRPLTHLPIVLDEVVLSPEDVLEATRQAGAGSINIKLGRVGGLTPARLLRDVAMSVGLTSSIEDTWGGDITTAAVSHLTASTPKESLLTASFFNDWTNEHVTTSPPTSVNGRGSAPLGSGLGIVVDEAALGDALFIVGSN